MRCTTILTKGMGNCDAPSIEFLIALVAHRSMLGLACLLLLNENEGPCSVLRQSYNSYSCRRKGSKAVVLDDKVRACQAAAAAPAAALVG